MNSAIATHPGRPGMRTSGARVLVFALVLGVALIAVITALTLLRRATAQPTSTPTVQQGENANQREGRAGVPENANQREGRFPVVQAPAGENANQREGRFPGAPQLPSR